MATAGPKMNTTGTFTVDLPYRPIMPQLFSLKTSRAPNSSIPIDLRPTTDALDGYTKIKPTKAIQKDFKDSQPQRRPSNTWKDKMTVSHVIKKLVFKDEQKLFRDARRQHQALKETLSGSVSHSEPKRNQTPNKTSQRSQSTTITTTTRPSGALKRAATECGPTKVSKRAKVMHKDPGNSKKMQRTPSNGPTQPSTPRTTGLKAYVDPRKVALERIQAEYEQLKAELDRLEAKSKSSKKGKTATSKEKKVYKFKFGKTTHNVTYPADAEAGQPLKRMTIHNKNHTSTVYY